jgi:photosystem II stability/assembly factor-like uncharacterized protein
LYAATNDGAYKSTDAGSSWVMLDGLRDFDLGTVAIDPNNPNNVFVTVAGRGGGFRSRDGGVTWRKLDLPGGLSIEASDFAFDPSVPGEVWAATAPNGVSESRDSGKTWQPMNAGLATLRATWITMETGGPLLLGTLGASAFVFRSPSAAMS